jgi:hypothetical protein
LKKLFPSIVEVVGAVLITAGVSVFAVPLGLVVAGAFCLLFGLAAER